MTGSLRHARAGTPADDPYTRAVVRLDDGSDVAYRDIRRFGTWAVLERGEEDAYLAARLGAEPLGRAFTAARLAARLARRRAPVKSAILDQRTLAGVGNIYADESLWRAKMHWARATDVLRRSDVRRLLAAIRAVFGEAIHAGGTSFDSLYVQVNGQSGYFDRSLAVYGREGEPCPRCGAPVVREKFMNRSSFRCPLCQPRPRRGRW
jgi:formamidopyrimidine-DNA glycosylase